MVRVFGLGRIESSHCNILLQRPIEAIQYYELLAKKNKKIRKVQSLVVKLFPKKNSRDRLEELNSCLHVFNPVDYCEIGKYRDMTR